MKYVIFKQKDLFMPVIMPDHVTHSQVKIEDAVPVSAGFFHLKGGVNIYGESESLQLKPNHEMDTWLLSMVLLNTGTAQFLDFNTTVFNK